MQLQPHFYLYFQLRSFSSPMHLIIRASFLSPIIFLASMTMVSKLVLMAAICIFALFLISHVTAIDNDRASRKIKEENRQASSARDPQNRRVCGWCCTNEPGYVGATDAAAPEIKDRRCGWCCSNEPGYVDIADGAAPKLNVGASP